MHLNFPFYCFIFIFFLTNSVFSAQSLEEYLEGFEYSDYERFEENLLNLCKKNNAQPQGDYAPMANLEGEPSAYVHGCVNVITGQYCDFQTDLVVHHGIDPIHFDRSFAGNKQGGSMIGYGWHVNHQSRLMIKIGTRVSDKKQIKHCFFEDDHGATPLLFEQDLSWPISDYRLRPEILYKGVTNTTQGIMSGQTNLRNMKYFVEQDLPHVRTGSNRVREYFYPSKKSVLYVLKSDIKPTGNKWVYNYTTKDVDHLSKIDLQNEHHISAGHMQFSINSLKTIKKGEPFRITTNDGRFVQYNIEMASPLLLFLQ